MDDLCERVLALLEGWDYTDIPDGYYGWGQWSALALAGEW